MKRIALLTLVALVGLVACSSVSLPPLPTPFVATPAPKTGKLRISLPVNPGVGDVPFFMALDALKSQGYTVETTEFAQFELLTAALVKGDLDIASGGNQQTWAAIAKGAPLRSIIGFNTDLYYIVARREISTCADLNGKRVAMNTPSGTYPSMFKEYLEQHCPGTTPQMDMIPAAGNRMLALLSGQADAALLKLDGRLEVERQAPGKFSLLISLNQEFPQVVLSGYHVRREFAAQNPELVRDVVRAVIQANRRVQDKQVLYDAIAHYFPDFAQPQSVADAYLAHGLWDLNGGWTPEHLRSSFDFFSKTGGLPAGLQLQEVADLSYLNAVLEEMGRK